MRLEVFFRGENDVTELGVPQCKVLRLNEIISNGSFNFCSFYRSEERRVGKECSS